MVKSKKMRKKTPSIQTSNQEQTIYHFLASIGKEELLKETLQQSGASKSKKLKR